MGISRDSFHKRRNTGGKRVISTKKRQYLCGRQPAHTKLLLQSTKHHQTKVVHTVRCRGGNLKYRALRLSAGNFSWGTEVCTRKCRILDVVYNASNNELVRTKTLVKGCIVEIDAAPFKTWFENHYDVKLEKKGEEPKFDSEKKRNDKTKAKTEARRKKAVWDQAIIDEIIGNRLLACISSRPGQCGRADGYLLEGEELAFYQKKIVKK